METGNGGEENTAWRKAGHTLSDRDRPRRLKSGGVCDSLTEKRKGRRYGQSDGPNRGRPK